MGLSLESSIGDSGEEMESETLTEHFEHFMGFVPDRLMIVDPRVGKPTGHEERAQLRSVPMLRDIGIKRYTYSAVWHPDVKLVDYKYQSLSEEESGQIKPPFCQIISQAVEDHSSSDLTRRLLQRDMDEPIILVTDQDTFSLKDAHGGRTVKEDFGFHVLDYDKIFQNYLRNIIGIEPPAIGLSITKNAVYHKIAATHKEHGVEVNTIADLFDYSIAPAESQVWDILIEFCQERESVLEGFDKYVRQNLRPWTERGEVGDITTSILDALQQCDFNPDSVKDYRSHHAGGR